MIDKYWLNQNGTLTVRNLKEENNKWDHEKFLKRDGLDLYNYMVRETYYFEEFNSDGCMYGAGGLRVEKGDTVVDIGANIGMWSILAVESGASEVYSFEPVRLNYICLCLNSSGFPIYPYNLGIGDRVQKKSIVIQDAMGFCVPKNYPRVTDTEDILIVTIDWLFDAGIFNKIDFLKIDVEGCEDQILFNISKERLEKINKIALEYHHYCPAPYKDIVDHLARNGIKQKFRLDLGDNMKVITFSR